MNRKKFYFLSWEEVVTMLTRFCFIPISNWVATYIYYDKGYSIVWKPFSHVNIKSRHYCCVGEKLNIKVGWLLSKLCCLDMSLTFVAKMGEVFRGPGFSSRLPKNDEKTFFQCSHSLCKIYFQWPKVGYRTKIAPSSWPTFLLPFLCKPKVSKLFLGLKCILGRTRDDEEINFSFAPKNSWE